MNKETFKKGDNIIWDSNFGYEIGYFIGEGNQDNTYLVNLKTGIVDEPCSYPIDEIFKYSDELISELTKKYGYEKSFSKEF